MTAVHYRADYVPTLGRIVLYRGPYARSVAVPAVIVATADTPADDTKPITTETAVHLVQFSAAAGMESVGGSYPVHDVPEDEWHDDAYTADEQTPGTWRWPRLPRRGLERPNTSR